MAWLELHQTLPTNKKTLRLKRLLGIRTYQAVGHLAMLWLWALDNAQDGDLSDFEAEEIAEIADWPGKDPQKLVGALIEAGFIDSDMHLHDWGDYTGRLIDKRKIMREQSRLRQQRRRDKVRQIQESNALVTRDNNVSNAPIQYSTVQNSTVQYSTVPINTTGTTNLKNGAEPNKETAAPVDPVFGLVIGTYQERINPMPSPEVVTALQGYLKAMNPEVVIKAFDIALDERKPTWSYINGILRAWKAKGIKTLLDLQQAQNEFERRKVDSKPAKAKTNIELLDEFLQSEECKDDT